MQDDFAVGSGLEDRLVLQLLSQNPVVVDLSIDGQDQGIVAVGQGLGSALCRLLVPFSHFFLRRLPGNTRTNSDNAETLVAQNWR